MKKHIMSPLAAGIVAAVLGIAAANAEDTKAIDRKDTTLTKEEVAESNTDTSPTMSEGATQGESDAHFVQKIASGGLAEVELGKLAQQKGASAEVKAYGKRMVDEHTANNEALKTLAQGKGLEVPTAPLPEEQAAIDRLSKLDGEAFDKAYKLEMVDSHAKMEQLLVETSTEADDDAIREFAKKTLVPVRDHEKHAQALHDGKAHKHDNVAASDMEEGEGEEAE